MKRKVKKTINIRHYKNKQEMNIGIVLFAFIFIYLVVTIFTYATAKRISVYEVREGSIVKDNSYTGLVLRKEQVFYADASGYVNYFQDENSKLRKGNNIYVLSNNKLNIPSGNDTEGTTLTNEEQNNLIYKIQDFNESYTNGHFSSVYSLKTEINSALHGAANQSKTSQLDAVIAGNSDVIATYPSDSDGILVLNVDGYENLTEDTLDNKNFDRSNYESTQLTDQTKIKAGDPVYKVVTDENWDVYKAIETPINHNDNKSKYLKPSYTYKGYTNSLRQICKHFNLNYGAIKYRVIRGMSVKDACDKGTEKPYTYVKRVSNLGGKHFDKH